MNFLDLLIKKRRVAGIEITDSTIRIAYFRSQKNTEGGKTQHKENKLILKETTIPPHIIENGIIKDTEKCIRILSEMWSQEGLQEYYAVASVQEDKIYSQLLSFPKNFNDAQLKEAVDLAINFQIPFNKKEAYTGWEKVPSSSSIKNEVLISALPISIADVYIKTFNNTGIHILAMESHLASLARSTKNQGPENVLLVKENTSSTTICILENNNLLFSRTIPHSIAGTPNQITGEIGKIKKSFEPKNKKNMPEISISASQLKDTYRNLVHTETDLDYKWFISIGALLRGELRPEEDTHISLLPISTREVYLYQKTTIFIALLRNIIVSVSLFFLIVFLATYFFVYSLSKNIHNNISTASSSDTTKEEVLLRKINSIGLISKDFLSTAPNWSILVEEINSKTIDGITITNFKASSLQEPIVLVGISKDRETLNNFKKALQSSAYLSDIKLPITNLEQKKDIPFTISFIVSDTNMLYFK